MTPPRTGARTALAVGLGQAVYRGAAEAPRPVRHEAACLVLPEPRTPAWLDGALVGEVAWVAPWHRHTLVSPRVSLVFFDPGHRVARAAPWEAPDARVGRAAARRAALRCLRAADPPAFAAMARAALTGLEDRPVRGLDARVLRLTALLDTRPTARLPEAAAALGLSASRLRHLVGEELGLSFKRLRRWAMVRRALVAARHRSFGAAAVAAGFADQAHFTRTFTAMFGQPPSRALGRSAAARSDRARSATRRRGAPSSDHASSA